MDEHRSGIIVFTLQLMLTLGALGLPSKAANAQSVIQGNAEWRVDNGASLSNVPSVIATSPLKSKWTTAGSTGTLDEDSLALAEIRDFVTTFRPGMTGTITMRYNITATGGLLAFCPATFAMVKMRYQNSDPTGVLSKYSWELRSSNIDTGGKPVLVTFSSTISSSFSNGNIFLTVTGTLGSVDFDFENNIYWLEVKIMRSDPAAFVSIGSFQFWESAGTACS
jgi:hypothetical protein